MIVRYDLQRFDFVPERLSVVSQGRFVLHADLQHRYLNFLGALIDSTASQQCLQIQFLFCPVRLASGSWLALFAHAVQVS